MRSVKAINLPKKKKALGLDNKTNELIIAGKQSLVKPLCNAGMCTGPFII